MAIMAETIVGERPVTEEQYFEAVKAGDIDVLKHPSGDRYLNVPDGAGEFGPAGWCPLHYAARIGYLDIAKLLLERGAWPGPCGLNWKTSGDEHPEGLAREFGHKAVADLICQVRKWGGWQNYKNTPREQLDAHQAWLDQRA